MAVVDKSSLLRTLGKIISIVFVDELTVIIALQYSSLQPSAMYVLPCA